MGDLHFAGIDPNDLPEDVLRQMMAIKKTMDEEGGGVPIPSDSPLGKYLIEHGTPLVDEDDEDD